MGEILSIQVAASNLSELVDKVLTGESVTIAKNGEPLVDLVIHQRSKRELGFGKDLIRVAPGYDIDAPDSDLNWNLDEDFS